MSLSPVHRRLRESTRALHAALEERFDAVEAFADPARRPELLTRHHRLYEGIEAAAAPWAGRLGGLDFAVRRRAPALARALARRGLPAPESRALAPPACTAEALGLLYVAEGSVLGGRAILAALDRRGVDRSELGFLDPYGRATGRFWRGFLEVLEAAADREPDRAAAERGALRGFAYAEACLCGEVTPA